MKKLLIASMLVSSLGGIAAAAHADIVREAPPPRNEVMPPPRHGYVWAPGHWEWRGHHYV
jgi:WXXGXW repeat (2 copies)